MLMTEGGYAESASRNTTVRWGVSYGADNPFEWMELISLQGKTNFFEKRVGEYQKAGVMSGLDDKAKNHSFSMSEDF